MPRGQEHMKAIWKPSPLLRCHVACWGVTGRLVSQRLRQGRCSVKQSTLHSKFILQARVEYKKFAGIWVVFKPTEELWLPLMSTISLTWEKEMGFHSSAQCCLHRQMQRGHTPEHPNCCSGLSRRCRRRTLTNSQTHTWGIDTASTFDVSCWLGISGLGNSECQNHNVHLLYSYTGCVSSQQPKYPLKFWQSRLERAQVE